MNILVLLSLMVIFLIITKHALCIYHHKHEHIFNQTCKLPDIIHDLFPFSDKTRINIGKISEFICISLLISMVFVLRDMNKLTCFILFFLLIQQISLLYYFVTTLPDSKHGECHKAKNVFQIMKKMGSCNHLNISGHLIINGLCLYFISYYVPIRICLLIYITSSLAIIMSKNHYTIDCVNSTILLLLIYSQRKNILKVVNKIAHTKYYLK